MPAMTDQKFAEFFAVMAGIYGHKWVSQYGTDTDSVSARVWRDGLASLELAQVASAVRHYKNQSISAAWPPSIPEFRLMALDLPSLAGYRYGLTNNHIGPFSILASRFVDSYRLRTASAIEFDKLTEEAYQLACEAVEQGVALPEVPVAIEQKPEPKREHATRTPEQEAKIREIIEAGKEVLA